MKPFSKSVIAYLAVCFGVLPLLAGCASSTPVRTTATPKELAELKRIAVVPFEKLTSGDASRMARCPVSGTVFTTCDLPQSADLTIQEFFLGKLEKSGRYSIIPPYQSDAVYRKVKGDNPKASATQQLQRTGKALEVDGVVAGYVACFRERVGYKYSAERPASVTFGIYLIRVSDGELAWGSIYEKTQQSLSENLLQASTFFGRGLKWVTAEELAEDGVDEMLKTFPGYR